MHDAVETAERHAQVLGELTELGMALAREVQAEALAAETPQKRAELVLAFHRISRSIRQSVALEARLLRERLRAEREDQAEAVRAETARVAVRRAQVRGAVERLIWNEAETEEDAQGLLADLDDRLSEDSLQEGGAGEGGAGETLDAHIARIRADLGLTAPQPDGFAPGQPAPPGSG